MNKYNGQGVTGIQTGQIGVKEEQGELLAGLPQVLTLEQAARVLQIGETTARGFCR